MEDYLKQTKPFANSEQLKKRHQEIQSLIKSCLENHLKGPKEFTAEYTIKLQEVYIRIESSIFTNIYFNLIYHSLCKNTFLE